MNINQSDTVHRLVNTSLYISNNDSTNLEGLNNPLNFPTNFNEVIFKMVLDAVFLIVNCAIVFAMWRKRGRRPSNLSLAVILATSVLSVLSTFIKFMRKNGYCNTVIKCALYGPIFGFVIIYLSISGLGLFCELVHTPKSLTPGRIHCRILLFSIIITSPVAFAYTLQGGFCVRSNVLGSRILQNLYFFVLIAVAVLVPRIYIIKVWQRCGFQVKLLGIGRRFDGVLAQKVNQVRWTFFITVCYFFFFVPAPLMKGIMDPKMTIYRGKEERFFYWGLAAISATYVQSLLQPVLLLCTYSYLPFSFVACCCKKARNPVIIEMSFWTRKLETAQNEMV